MIEKSQVFTPQTIVAELLDSIDYKRNLYGKRILENSCGDGNILIEIVKRYIIDSISKKIEHRRIREGLERDIVGVELDKNYYFKCKRRLNNLAAAFGIRNVRWNIINGDFLRISIKGEFDYIVGNPPYINHRELDLENRSFLKDKFISCKNGKFDYCYAFIESSLNYLNSTGKLSYIIPNSIFKNVYGQNLRNLILPSVSKIYDYSSMKLFKQALTSSIILVCDKKSNSKVITYYDVVKKNSFNILKCELDDKWIFSNQLSRSCRKSKFSEYFTASISIATLLNKVYVLDRYTADGKFIYIDGYKIEKELVRIGVSPKTLSIKKEELIIFPYRYIEGRLVRYNAKEFETLFPEATKYLKSFHYQLSQRNNEKNINWFEYGRSQALMHLNQPKLLLSTVVTEKVKVYQLPQDVIPYSGIYIIPKNNASLEWAKEILQSSSFYEYVKSIGINANGSSKRITATDINNYYF